LTRNAPYKGLGADSEEKHEPASDIDTAVVDSLKALDLERPIKEADKMFGAGVALVADASERLLRFVCSERVEAN
jgi:hypothetical protein